MDEVRRETTLTGEPEEVWRAISDESMLERWLGDEVELEPVVGGDLRVLEDGEERTGTVEEVEDGRRLVFTWARPGDDPSRVELTISPAEGGSRLTVVETAPAGSPDPPAWNPRLAALRCSFEPAYA